MCNVCKSVFNALCIKYSSNQKVTGNVVTVWERTGGDTWFVWCTRNPPGWKSPLPASSGSSSPFLQTFGCTWSRLAWFSPCGGHSTNRSCILACDNPVTVLRMYPVIYLLDLLCFCKLHWPQTSIFIVRVVDDGSTCGQLHAGHGGHGPGKHRICITEKWQWIRSCSCPHCVG